MKSCLIDGHPFVFGISVYDSFMGDDVKATGIVPMPKSNERVQGGHAITSVGFDDSKAALICANSWGVDWGIAGYFYLPYNYVSDSDLACDFWTARR
jgi:C1A family cysteine protease